MTTDPFEPVTDEVLAAVAPHYGVQIGDLRRIGQSGNSVHEFWRGEHRFVLRVTASVERTLGRLRGELDWIGYLHDNEVAVSTVIPSDNGHEIEIVELDGTSFAAVVFNAARGIAPVDFVADWTDDFYQRWGQLVGRMHALATTYCPSAAIYRRPEWHETDDIAVERYAPAAQTVVRARCRELIAELAVLPQEVDSYGLIHADLHRGNFFVDGDRLTVFDFDSCQYCWFAYDIAVSLFHAVMEPPGGVSREAFARRFLDQFMLGYRRAHPLADSWLARLPIFLRLRRLVMYVDGLRCWDLDHLTQRQERYLNRYRQLIMADEPVLELEFP